MKFWDSSAIVPLSVDEEETDYCLNTLSEDHEMLVWCLSSVEVVSALCRRHRERFLGEVDFQKAKRRLHDFLNPSFEVTSINQVRNRALRLLEVHPIRAADACQLASALVATKEDPSRLKIVCFDQRLMRAAAKEGFIVNPGRDDNV